MLSSVAARAVDSDEVDDDLIDDVAASVAQQQMPELGCSDSSEDKQVPKRRRAN